MSIKTVRFCITCPELIYKGRYSSNKIRTFDDLQIIKYSLSLLKGHALRSLTAFQKISSTDHILQEYYLNIIDRTDHALMKFHLRIPGGKTWFDESTRRSKRNTKVSSDTKSQIYGRR